MQTKVLVAILGLITTDIAIHTTGFDVKQFVNTSEQIWTLKTTQRRYIKCEVDQLQSIAEMSIVFKRSVFIRGTRCDFTIRGVFDAHHKERMTLFYKGTLKRVENLLYMAHDYSCAVFKIASLTDWHDVHYDLRVRNSSIHTRPGQNCRHYYKEVIGHQPSFYVYTARCQQFAQDYASLCSPVCSRYSWEKQFSASGGYLYIECVGVRGFLYWKGSSTLKLTSTAFCYKPVVVNFPAYEFHLQY